jgi:hypothetical protein
MSFQPFKSERDLTQFAARFFKDRVQSFRKDVGICLTAKADGHHAYFPALITCIGFLDFLSGLNAGKLEGHGLTELKAYICKFFHRKGDYEHADILYVMFRHKIAHLAYPYLVFDTATKPRDFGPPHRRITWTVGIYRGKKPLELIVYPTSRTLIKSVTPWPVSYDARMVVSLTTLRTDIIKSIYGPSGYLSHLRSDTNARGRFARCIKEYAPP